MVFRRGFAGTIGEVPQFLWPGGETKSEADARIPMAGHVKWLFGEPARRFGCGFGPCRPRKNLRFTLTQRGELRPAVSFPFSTGDISGALCVHVPFTRKNSPDPQSCLH